MADVQAGDPSELLSVEQASALLEVTPDRVAVMVDQGLLTPAGGEAEPRFARAEVLAARALGG